MATPEIRDPPPAACISDLLTVIITTSPTPSAPSTELLSAVLDSFRTHCADLLRCPVIVVFDTFDRIGDENRLKRGQVTAQHAANYNQYKDNVKGLVLNGYYSSDTESQSPTSSSTSTPTLGPQAIITEMGTAEYGWERPPTNFVALLTTRTEDNLVTFIEPSERLGFGLAVRSALRLARTPFVWVQQHDWPLVSNIPLTPILEVMRSSGGDETTPVKYVCLPSVRMLSYATSAHVVQFPALKALTARLKRDFIPTSQPESMIPLTPLFFWHDKPHLASTAHYLARVFPSRLALSRGDFIEDSIGQRARAQMKEGLWAKWACWLYYPDGGTVRCVRHLDGRKWRGAEGEKEAIRSYRAAAGILDEP